MREKISIVFPVYNEAENLRFIYEEVRKSCAGSDVDYEMIFVDDGSTDGSLEILRQIASKDKAVKYISLSRNFGHQNALFAGMSYAAGDAVITMDADLQHPPSLIPKMIELWRKGNEVVYTMKKNAQLTLSERCFFNIFYWLMSRISGLELGFGQSDFRLLDKKVLSTILAIPEYHKFLRGQVKWVGFRQTALSYDVEKRHGGKGKYSYKKRLNFALDGIFAFSRYPLHFVMLIGVTVSAVSSLFILFVSMLWLLKKLNLLTNVIVPPGWATMVVAIFFLGSIQLIAIGILGEYVGRIYDQAKGRPIFIVKESSDNT